MCIASSATGRSVIGVVKVMTIGLATPTVDPFDGFTDARLKEAVPEGVSSTAPAVCSKGAEVSDGSTTSAGDGSVGEATLPSGSASACGAITKATRTVRAPIAAAARMPVGLRMCIFSQGRSATATGAVCSEARGPMTTVPHSVGAYSYAAQRNKHELNADSSLLDLTRVRYSGKNDRGCGLFRGSQVVDA